MLHQGGQSNLHGITQAQPAFVDVVEFGDSTGWALISEGGRIVFKLQSLWGRRDTTSEHPHRFAGRGDTDGAVGETRVLQAPPPEFANC